MTFNDAELTDGTAGDFANLVDSSNSNYVGMKYDYTNQQFVIYESHGGRQVLVKQAITGVEFWSDLILNFAPSGVYMKVLVYHAGTYQGTFTTGLANGYNIDLIRAGVLHATGAAHPVDRQIRHVKAGSAYGLSDLFNDQDYPDGTIVPPWGAVNVHGSVTCDNHTLRVVNAGSNAYAGKMLVLPRAAPPPPGVANVISLINDPIHMLFKGNSDWKQAGSPRWYPNVWELDRVVVPVQGRVTALNAFMNSIKLGLPWSEDRNMFLMEYPMDDHKQFPTLNLTFSGKRGGVLPPDKSDKSSSIAQVSGIMQETIFFTGGLAGFAIIRQQVNITYMSPVTKLTVFTRDEFHFSDAIAEVQPPALDATNIISLVIGQIDEAFFSSLVPEDYNRLIETVLVNFFQRNARFVQSQEVVPGQYWRTTITNQTLLFPIVTQ